MEHTTIRVRSVQLRKYMQMKGIKTPAALARQMGVDRSTVTRAIHGSAPSADFAYRLCAVFPELSMTDLFEVVDEPERCAA